MEEEITISTKFSLYSLSATLLFLAIADKCGKKFWFYPRNVPAWFNNISLSIFLIGMTTTSVLALYPIYVDMRRLIKK